MYKTTRFQKILALVVVLSFLVALTPGPASAISLGGSLGTLIKIFGIAWVVNHFDDDINDTINRFMSNEGVGIDAKTRVVPILRVGEGLAVGAAQIAGPAERVDLVKAVAQLGWEPGSLRGRVLLPVSTDKNITDSIRGVDGVGVSAVIQFPL